MRREQQNAIADQILDRVAAMETGRPPVSAPEKCAAGIRRTDAASLARKHQFRRFDPVTRVHIRIGCAHVDGAR
jgi:hypothetical protein